MNKRTLLAGAIACAALLPASAQYGSPKAQQVAGTWMVTSVVNTLPDGTKTDVFGTTPLGHVILSPEGYFSVMFMRNDLPKFASGARLTGTPEENTAVVRGSLAYTGSYTVEGGDLVMKVNASTFPAWIGQVQKRKFTVEGDQLRWVGVAAQGTVVVTVKRVK